MTGKAASPDDLPRPLRYVVVMAIGWVVDFATFALLARPVGIVLAQLAARSAGAVTGFVLHRVVTFAGRDRIYAHGRRRQFTLYGVVWLVNYVVTVIGIELLVHVAGWPELAAKLAVEIVVVPSNFLVLRRFVFKTH